MTINFSTSVGVLRWTKHFYFFSGVHIDSSHVPTLNNLVVTKLEHYRPTGSFWILNNFTVIHECFIINNCFIARVTMPTPFSDKSLFHNFNIMILHLNLMRIVTYMIIIIVKNSTFYPSFRLIFTEFIHILRSFKNFLA